MSRSEAWRGLDEEVESWAEDEQPAIDTSITELLDSITKHLRTVRELRKRRKR